MCESHTHVPPAEPPRRLEGRFASLPGDLPASTPDALHQLGPSKEHQFSDADFSPGEAAHLRELGESILPREDGPILFYQRDGMFCFEVNNALTRADMLARISACLEISNFLASLS